MSKSQTKKQEKWKKQHPNTTRTAVARIKKLKRLEKYKLKFPKWKQTK